MRPDPPRLSASPFPQRAKLAFDGATGGKAAERHGRGCWRDRENGGKEKGGKERERDGGRGKKGDARERGCAIKRARDAGSGRLGPWEFGVRAASCASGIQEIVVMTIAPANTPNLFTANDAEAILPARPRV